MLTLQQIWNKYPQTQSTWTRGLPFSWGRYYAARDWRLADVYGFNSDVRFEWWCFRSYVLLPSRLPQ